MTAGSAWKLSAEDGIGNLQFDQPDTDVNILTSENLKALKDILTEISQRTDLKALLITSAKERIFIAGADINEIAGISDPKDAFTKAEQGKEVFQLLEDLKIPTVCVINGACLGGGYELALSCRYRVASFSDKIKIGLPEVNLGILPGFGGSIRLPRLVGLLRALPLILAGQVVSAESALKNGMVDKLFPEQTLLEEATKFAKRIPSPQPSPHRPVKGLSWFLEDTPFGRKIVFQNAHKDVLKKTKGFYPAPLEIIELIRKTYGRDSKEAFRLESEHFSRLGATEVSKNLIKLFFVSEKYKKLRWTEVKVAANVRKCGVIGAGVMGGGIAQLVSYKDIPVRVKDINEKALAGALKEAASLYRGALKRKKIKRHEIEFKMGLISVGLTNAGLKSCDILIEAVVEDLGIKQKVFRELSEISPNAILASNTSSLPVTKMAEVCKSPERVVGLHFFNPVNRMPLVEVIRAAQTSSETLENAIQFARRLGKTVIVVQDRPGFLVNRLLLPYMNEAAYLMEEGMSPEVIDAIVERFGMPMGPIELIDQVGIDVGYKVAHVLQEAFGPRMKVAGILEGVKEKGLLGKKSGKGFYLYEGKKKIVNQTVKSAFNKTPQISEEDALKRMMFMMINEAAHCLEEKVIDSPATVDIGMAMGTGFPPFRGGLLHYADCSGARTILRDLERFQNETKSERFAPSPYLRRLAEKDEKFYKT